MIEIDWTVRMDCTGGNFSVPDGTPASDIARKIDDIVQGQIRVLWSPSIGSEKDAVPIAKIPLWLVADILKFCEENAKIPKQETLIPIGAINLFRAKIAEAV